MTEAARERLTIAYFCTGHGLGHATRVIEVCKHLIQAGHSVTVVTAAPESAFAAELPLNGYTLRRATLDTGAKQLDAFTVDQRGSLEDYAAVAVARREEILAAETAWLSNAGVDLVVSDVVPLACAAAAAAGVPSVAVSNFSWDFLYSEYVNAAGAEFRPMIWQIADDYACAQRVLRLPGYVPMPAFREVVDVPLVVRKARRGREEVRRELGVPAAARLALFMYGGQPAGADWRVHEGCLPPGWACLVLSNPAPGQPLPKNFILAPGDAYTPDLVEACDVVLGKIGYGTASECLAHRRPLVFLRRDFFNEEPFLRKLLELHGAAVEMKRRDFLAGNWAPYLEAAAALTPAYDEPINGAEVVASLLERAVHDARAGATVLSPGPVSGGGGGSRAGWAFAPRPGSARLRDTIAWGYIMARHAAREQVDVPEWYTRGHLDSPDPPSPSPPAPPPALLAPNGSVEVPGDGVFDVVDGPADLGRFPDTLRFLALLGALGEGAPAPGSKAKGGARELPERRAARGLFRWEDEVLVARAPGRLDVMGGIADYSGSLVLQAPLAEAAHVAVQRHPPGTQRVWRHQAARSALGATSTPSGPSAGPTTSPQATTTRTPAPSGPTTTPSTAATIYGNPTTSPHAAASHPPAASGSGATTGPTDAATAASGSTTRLTTTTTTAGAASAPSSASGGSSGSASPPGELAGVAAVPPALRIVSLDADATNRGPAFDMPLAELLAADGSGAPISYDAARAYFRRDPALAWAAYVAGALVVLMHEKGARVDPGEGLSVLVASGVPEGKGVSSSAAVEVAAMGALAAALGVTLGGRELALLCQKVENLVVGAPCGVMDQMASALGRAGALLALRCQPAEVEGTVALPPGLRFWGLDSGIRHSVGGSDYGAVRVGAFMGLRMASQLAHEDAVAAGTASEGDTVEAVGRGYLANVSPSEFAARYEARLPEAISGAAFLERYGSHWDGATRVDPGQTYAVRRPAAHPVQENFRVQAFRQVLAACPPSGATRGQLEVLGELMLQSHVSYGACGLGSAGTDRLVDLVLSERWAAEAAGEAPALYGAKITGGGCGGTVCVLGTADARGEAALARVAARYAAEAAHAPQVFAGASAGAVAFGVARLRRKPPPRAAA